MTTVLVIGGVPGAALPVSPFEHWYAAHGPASRGDARAAADLVAAGLADHPQNAGLHFHLARFLAPAGDRAGAAEHLATAIALDPALRERAAADPDLSGLG